MEESILLKARQALDSSQLSAIRELTCEMRDGKIIINGIVPSFYLKQVAQETLLKMNIRIENRVLVAGS